MVEKRKFKCYDCNHIWEEPFGTGRPPKCPKCGSTNIHREDTGPRGPGRGRGPSFQ
jgi:Zn finger protein HypA/HybF involved in hydrogenase expression